MDLNIQPFKEPRGFIRLLQWLFAICAFATTVDYSGKFGFTFTCANSTSTSAARAEATADYPFNLEQSVFTISNGASLTSCTSPNIQVIGNSQSEAVFYVFTGVITFLYTTVMVAVYLLADKMYLNNRRFPLVDFFITIILAVFWLAGASAFAHGLSSLSTVMDVKQWLDFPNDLPASKYTVTGYFYDSTSKLVISVLFGYINFVLWAGNIWFLYKETSSILNGGIGMGGSAGGASSSGP